VAADEKEKVSRRILPAVVGWLGKRVLHFIGGTSRLTVHTAPETRSLLESDRPVIFAFWHRYQLLMAYEHRGRGVGVLVSRSRDGDLIAAVLERMGFRTARGSSSRGGGPALLELMNILSAGGRVAVTPDGPRGPRGSVQPGVIFLAEKSGVPVVPLAWAGGPVSELRSWDAFLIPRPFGRYTVYFGAPLAFSSSDGQAGATLQRALIEAENTAATLL
jgi:lysophospholipid acyltransferase (LPLAT)-like uncharacterized protein